MKPDPSTASLEKAIHDRLSRLRGPVRERAETDKLRQAEADYVLQTLSGEDAILDAGVRQRLGEAEKTVAQAAQRVAYLDERLAAEYKELEVLFPQVFAVFKADANSIRIAGRASVEDAILPMVLPEHEANARHFIAQLLPLCRFEREARVVECMEWFRAGDPIARAEMCLKALALRSKKQAAGGGA